MSSSFNWEYVSTDHVLLYLRRVSHSINKMLRALRVCVSPMKVYNTQLELWAGQTLTTYVTRITKKLQRVSSVKENSFGSILGSVTAFQDNGTEALVEGDFIILVVDWRLKTTTTVGVCFVPWICRPWDKANILSVKHNYHDSKLNQHKTLL